MGQAFAADNIINAPGSGQMYLKDNLGRTVPAIVTYTTDGNGTIVPVFSPMMNINIGTVNQGGPGLQDWKVHDSIFQASFDAWKTWADVNLSTRASEATLSALNAKVVTVDTGNVTISNFPAVQPVSQSGTWTTGRTWTLLDSTDSVTSFQGGSWDINDITGTISLPTGAATAAKQDTGNASVASIDSKLAPLGQTTMAGSVPVAIASDQSPIPVSQSGTWTTGRTWSLLNSTDSVTAFQGGTWNINNISGTISLPTGAATAARQDTGNASLASLDSKFNSLGQKTMANSAPVVIASDQSAVPASQSGTWTTGRTWSLLNSTDSVNAVQSGSWTTGRTWTLSNATDSIAAVQSGTWTVQQGSAPWSVSQSGNWDIRNITGTVSLPTGASTEATLAALSAKVTDDFGVSTAAVRTAAQVGNASGAAAFGAGTTSVQTLRVVLPTDQTSIPAAQSGTWTTGRTWSLLNSTDSVNAVQSGTWTTGRTWTLASGTDSIAAVQSGTWNINNVSGTISLPTGAATETTVAKLTQTQGSTTSGQSGPLTQAAVTTAAPTYTTGQTSPLSLTTAGGLRVDFSGSSVPLPAGAATEATLAKLTQTQGSTTSGQSGPLVQGAVTTSDPTYTTAQTSPLSIATTGRLRVQTTGNVSSGATDSGDPVKIGAIVNQDGTAFTNAQRANAQADTNGSIYVNNSGRVASYSASNSFQTAATASDIFTLTGSGTKTIRIRSLQVTGTNTGNTNGRFTILKRSTADTGGTSTTATAVPHDSNSAAATATARSYTANPTLGTLVGNMISTIIFLPSLASSNVSYRYDFHFGQDGAQPVVLRGTSEVFAVSLNSVALLSTTVMDVSVDWTEE